jgi:hypothetical protein
MSPTQTARRARSSERSILDRTESPARSHASDGPAVDPEFRDAWRRAVAEVGGRSQAS